MVDLYDVCWCILGIYLMHVPNGLGEIIESNTLQWTFKTSKGGVAQTERMSAHQQHKQVCVYMMFYSMDMVWVQVNLW